MLEPDYTSREHWQPKEDEYSEEEQEKIHAAPPGSWGQFKTAAKSQGDRSAGQGRHPKLLSFLSLMKAGWYRRDAEIWSQREKADMAF